MKEFKLLIRNLEGASGSRPADKQVDFLRACEHYIGDLKQRGKLIAAQPLERDGVMLSGREGAWREGPYKDSDEVIVGYYQIVAEDLAEAVAIAKGNPEFAFTDTARVEVRPVKGSEKKTGFVYPGQG